MSELQNSPKISVIIPVYRPGKLFYKCIDSVRNQTLKDIEIILVDDCGNDGTFDYVRKMQTEDPRIHVITNDKNSGPGISRNKGIDCAKGDYIFFLDADDYLSHSFLESLYKKTEEKSDSEKPNAVCGSFVIADTDGKVIDTSVSLNNLAMINKWKPNKQTFNVFSIQVWCNIYYREWLKNESIYFGASYYGEDSTFLLQASWKAKCISSNHHALVYHVNNENSLMQVFNPERLHYQALSFSKQMAFLKDNVTDFLPSQYINDRIFWYLSNHSLVVAFGCYDAEAEIFLQNLKETMLSLPWIDEIKKESIATKALLEYGYNLCPPYVDPLIPEITSKACIMTLSKCVDFIKKFPDQKYIYNNAMNKVSNIALKTDIKLKMISQIKRKQFREQCIQVVKNDSGIKISENNIIWHIYLKTGLNLFNKQYLKRPAHFFGKLYHFGAKKLWKRKNR